MTRFACTALTLTLAAASFAEITYRVEVQPDKGNLHVTIKLSKTEKGSAWQIPNWSPGAYVLRNGSTGVQNFAATNGSGTELKFDKVEEKRTNKYESPAGEWKESEYTVTTWKVEGSKDTVIQYDISASLVDGAVHYSGPSVYMYEVGRKAESCKLELSVPAKWPVYVGLDELKAGTNVFKAADYDTLADNPVSTGDLIVDTYTSRGKPHYIVMRGAVKSQVDRAKLMKACKFVTDAETDFFGGKAPYNKYVWHFSVFNADDGAGGLEHLSSTQIQLSRGVGPRAVSVIAHEFFHLWNVKRIRSKVLGPFDYTNLPKTGALWWLEGVTDYYASTLLFRYGWTDETTYFASISSNWNAVRNNPAFKEVSPNDASLRVVEAAGGRGNSNGYRISYYNLGWLAGMCLDIGMNQITLGKKSLDDVQLGLWELCQNGKPGFEEDAIRKICTKNSPMFGPVYDRIVNQPNMPIPDALAFAGLRIGTKEESFADIGFSVAGGPGSTMLMVGESTVADLKPDDGIMEVNGKPINSTNGRERVAQFNQATASLKPNDQVKLRIKRGQEEMEVTVTVKAGKRSFSVIERNPDANKAQVQVRDWWLKHKSLKP